MTNEAKKYIIVHENFFLDKDAVVNLAPTVLKKILEQFVDDTSTVYYISGPQCGEYPERLGEQFLESNIRNIIAVTGTYSTREAAEKSIKEKGFHKIKFMLYTRKRVMEVPQKR